MAQETIHVTTGQRLWPTTASLDCIFMPMLGGEGKTPSQEWDTSLPDVRCDRARKALVASNTDECWPYPCSIHGESAFGVVR